MGRRTILGECVERKRHEVGGTPRARAKDLKAPFILIGPPLTLVRPGAFLGYDR